MKYQIDTIPVWDTVKEHCECPFCLLQEKAEAKQLDFYLGDSVMQSHIRVRTNETGFCAQHYAMMLKSDRKLSLGLMCATHSHHTMKHLQGALDTLSDAAENPKKQAKALDQIISSLTGINEKCVICQDIDYDIMRYLHTYIHLFKKDPQFKEEMKSSKGFCMKHFAALLSVAREKLSGKALSEFVSIAAPLQRENMERLEGEVKWFCDKFDYRNTEKPWGNSRDALPRMVTKLGGRLKR